MKISVVALVICLMTSACVPKKPTDEQPKPKKGTQFIHGAKLIIQDEAKGKIGVYLQKVKIPDDLLVNGKPVKEKHSFELGLIGSYSSESHECKDSSVALNFLHEIPSKRFWHFPPDAKTTIYIDGTSMNLKLRHGEGLQKDDPKDTVFWESLIGGDSCQIYARLLKAKEVRIDVGNGSIKLSDENVAAIGEFASAMGFD